MKNILKILIICLILNSPNIVAHAALSANRIAHNLQNNKSGCAAFLAQHPEALGTITPEIASKIVKAYQLLTVGRYGFSEKEVKTFLESGWPVLQKYGRANDRSLAETIRELFDQMEFIEQAKDSGDGFQKNISKLDEVFFNLVKWLDDQTKDGRAVREADLHFVRRIIIILHSLAIMVTDLDIDYSGSSDLNPLLPLDDKQITKILNKIESVTEDVVLKVALDYEERSNEKKLNREKLREEKLSKQNAQDRNQLEDNSALSAATGDIPNSQSGGKSQYDSPDLSKNTSDSIYFERPSNSPKDLMDVVQSKDQIIPEHIYSYTNARNEEFTIEFSSEISKVAQSGERDNIRKLLASIYVGNGIYSGVKLLTSRGKNVMEIKTTIHGHKRLIGCIEGRHLKIKKFYNIPDSKAAYARIIPDNLCD